MLAALPGWGKTIWVDQCAHFLEETQPELTLYWAKDEVDLGISMDDALQGQELVCFLDARERGTDLDFWEGLVRVLRARPWARCVVVAYDDPPADLVDFSQNGSEATSPVVADYKVMHEVDLAFDAAECAAISDMLSREGLLNDLLLTGERERGCPYLIGQQIGRLAARSGAKTWIPIEPGTDTRLLVLFDEECQRSSLPQSHIGASLVRARQYRAFAADLIAQGGLASELAAAVLDRLVKTPLFDEDTDDEFQSKQCVWRDEVWRSIGEGESETQRRARLRRGHEGVRRSGRIAAQLYYLLELGELLAGEQLVRSHFRWFMFFCDERTKETITAVGLDVERTPALALLESELALRNGEERALSFRSKAHRAFLRLRHWSKLNLQGEIERSGLLAFAASSAGLRNESVRYQGHTLELIDTVDENGGTEMDEDTRTRLVGACYLAYFAALQVDHHDMALQLATSMIRHSDPRDRMYFYEQVSLVTEQDLHGLRSLSVAGERPSGRWHSQAQSLLDLEEGNDAAALAFLRPVMSSEHAGSRSAIDALTLLVRAICAPEELSIREIERPLRLSREAWDDQRASSFLVWASVIAFATIGAMDEARSWVAAISEADDDFAAIARMTFAYWEGDVQAADLALERLRKTNQPRLAVSTGVLTAGWLALQGEAERAVLCLEKVWREHPAPRLFRFALRLIPQRAFEALWELAAGLPVQLCSVFEASSEDGRGVMWIECPKLTPSEREILMLMWAGKSNKEIAAARFVTVGTLRSQLKTLYRKLGATSRLEALSTANRFRLLDV